MTKVSFASSVVKFQLIYFPINPEILLIIFTNERLV